MCLEFVPAGVSCLCPYENMLHIGPVNFTHTHTAREAEKKKRRDHGVGAVGHTFVPFAIETYGRLGVEAVKLLKDWAKTAGEADLMDRNGNLVWMKREISVSLIKGTARMFRRFVGLLTRGVGQRYLSGDSHLNIA